MYHDTSLRVSVHRSTRGEIVLRADAQGAFGVDDAASLAATAARLSKELKLPFSGDFYAPEGAGSVKKAFQTGEAPAGWCFVLNMTLCRRKSDGRKFAKPTLALLPERPEGVTASSTKLA